jgi:hypothetical protein
MAEHTPGLWVVERSQRCFLVVSKDEMKDWPILVAQTGSDIEIDRANARLIAAAPELLERLSDLCDRAERARALLRRDGGFWGMLDTTRERAAIAKAAAEE